MFLWLVTFGLLVGTPLVAYLIGLRQGLNKGYKKLLTVKTVMFIEGESHETYSWACPDCPEVLTFLKQFDLDKKMYTHIVEKHT